MHETEKRALIERYVRAYNAFDIAGLLSTVTQSVRFEDHSGQRLTVAADGVDALRQLAAQSATLFSEREQRILSLRLHPAGAVTEIAFRGVLATPMSGAGPVGTVIELEGSTTFSFENGLISKIVDRSRSDITRRPVQTPAASPTSRKES